VEDKQAKEIWTSPAHHNNNSWYANSASNATATTANGLFLLSQAHPELMKLEAQHASHLDGDDDSTSSNVTSVAVA
jgi:hypothetical protein